MDTKSVASYGDSISYDSKTGSARANTKRQRHMLQIKRRQENASQRKLLFRPKIFESWKEGDMDDEIAERERLIKDIAAKERKLAERKRLMEQGETHDSEEEEEENAMIKALDRLKSRKQREDEFQVKLELDRKHVEEDKAMELEEKLQSEMQNPSVYGWYYTNGYYDNVPYFGVREDLVPKLNQEQEEWREKWTEKYPETFTAKFKRFFWPPKFLMKGKVFRTRGSYMDFPEVISDWPKFAGLEINFERDVREYITNRHELFGVDEEQKAEDEKALAEAALLEQQQLLEEGLAGDEDPSRKSAAGKGLRPGFKGPGVNVLDFDIDGAAEKDTDSHHWYYDDEEGLFYKKKLGFDIEYYYDGLNHCWRHKKKKGKYSAETQQTPYDYYFDDTTRSFKARDTYRGYDEMVYDPKSAVFRIHVLSKGNKKTKDGKPIYQFADFKDDASMSGTEEGKSKGKYTPKSYYFDEEFGKWILRAELPEGVQTSDIMFDENGKRYARKFEAFWRGLTGLSPDDYFWNDRIRKFFPKPARQAESFKYFPTDGVWRKTDDAGGMSTLHSEDIAYWYFDDFEGQYNQKEQLTGRYIQGRYSKIWRKVPKPKSNMYPEEFYWDRYKKKWLPRAVRMEMLKNAEVSRQKNIQGAQAGGLFDIKQNENVKPEDFYWDEVEGVFLKKRPNEEYVMDDQDKVFRLEKSKDKPHQVRFHHEYYYDMMEKNFVLKGATDAYTYDVKFGVWKKGNEDISQADPGPKDYYFDFMSGTWMKMSTNEAIRYDHIVGINVKPHLDSNFKSPDDYWFHDNEGRFYPKNAEEAATGNYIYDSGEGVWKHKEVKGPSVSGLAPRSFYWDDVAMSFKLQVKNQKGDYFYDGKSRIYRHIAASGRTKSGFKPNDFMWNNEYKNYIPLSILKKQRGNITDVGEAKPDPMRTYEKPWMSAAPLRNPDTSKKDGTVAASDSQQAGWLNRNKVAPEKGKK